MCHGMRLQGGGAGSGTPGPPSWLRVAFYFTLRERRFNQQATAVHPTAAGDDVRREACRAALQFAQQYNAFVEEAGAQLAAVRGWQAVMEVAFTRRYAAQARGCRAIVGATDREV